MKNCTQRWFFFAPCCTYGRTKTAAAVAAKTGKEEEEEEEEEGGEGLGCNKSRKLHSIFRSLYLLLLPRGEGGSA